MQIKNISCITTVITIIIFASSFSNSAVYVKISDNKTHPIIAAVYLTTTPNFDKTPSFCDLSQVHMYSTLYHSTLDRNTVLAPPNYTGS